MISPAFAQTSAAQDPFLSFLPLILMFVVLYFLMIRPQMKRAKEHKTLVENLKKNDEVIPCINIKASDLKTQAIVLAYTNFSISDTQKCQYFLIRNNNRDTQDRISETEFPTGASQWSIVWQISRYGDPRKREKYSLFSRLR